MRNGSKRSTSKHREMIDRVFTELSPRFTKMYSEMGRLSIIVAGPAAPIPLYLGRLASSRLRRSTRRATLSRRRSAETVLTASEAVEAAAGDVRAEVESFLRKVAV